MSSGGIFRLADQKPQNKASGTAFQERHGCGVRQRHVFLGIAMVTVVFGVTLGLGLGVGLTRRLQNKHSSDVTPSDSTIASTSWWKPLVGSTWQIDWLYPLNDTSFNVSIYDIDLFTNNSTVIKNLHAQGRKVICYFSAGSIETSRPDAKDFLTSDFGNEFVSFPGEYWADTRSKNVRDVMLRRLDLAAAKKCDGVDPDNINAYNAPNGVNLTPDDAVSFIIILSDAAHARNLSIGLKNGREIVDQVLSRMDWVIDERCGVYQTYGTFQAFIDAGKPVLCQYDSQSANLR